MSNFYISFYKNEAAQTKVRYKCGKQKSYRHAEMVKEEVKDRRIVKVLRKYLDINLDATSLSEFESSDYAAFGELLFDLIFSADENMFLEFKEWYNEMANNENDESFNIFLEFETLQEFDELAILPWEYIYYRPKDRASIIDYPFLAASNDIVNFYRKVPFTFIEGHDKQSLEITTPLEILLIISSPAGSPMREEKKVFKYFRELSEVYPEDKLVIKYIYQPEESNFISELNNGKKLPHADNKELSAHYSLEEQLGKKIEPHNRDFSPHIIHFVGHGGIRDKKGFLVFSECNIHQTRIEPKEIYDEDFSSYIKDSRLNPKLVFLQACNGCRIADYVKQAGTTVQLLKKGIPFVIAMQNPVSEADALTFTKSFYKNFMEGRNIGRSVTIARYELGGKGNFSLKAFGSPVLFTCTDIPLKLKTIVEEEEDSGKLQIIKFCNTPNCPYYLDESRYQPLDMVCARCNKPLLEKRNGKIVEETDVLSRPDEMAVKKERPTATGITRKEKEETEIGSVKRQLHHKPQPEEPKKW